MYQFLCQIFPYAIAYTVPIFLAALGGLFSERSGIVNIALEGMMVVGTFVSAYVIIQLRPTMGENALWMGLLASMIIGALFACLHAFASINLKANQVISGTAINMLTPAITIYLARVLTGTGKMQLIGFKRFRVPFLADIPIIGSFFFTNVYPTTILAIAILILCWFILYKTAFGMRLRACGENPNAVDAAGISVYKMRYMGVMISGALASLAGACIIVTYSGEFSGSVFGLGFLALAALVFGNWKPVTVLIATFFFGFASTIATVAQITPALSVIPPVILKAFPYVATLFALTFFSKTVQAPKAAGEVFDKGKR